MKRLALALFLFASTASAAEPRDLWLAGRWEKAEKVIERRIADAKQKNDAAAELKWTVERAYFALDRNAFHKPDPAAPARAAVDAAQTIAARSGDRHAIANATHAHARFLYWEKLEGRGEWAPVEAAVEDALRMRESLGDRRGIADSYFYRGLLHQFQDRPEPAREAFTTSLRFADHPLAQSYARRHLGYVAQTQGDLAAAREHYEASLALRKKAGADILVPFALNVLANFELETTKDAAKARKLLRESLRVARCSGSTRAENDAREALAALPPKS